MSSAVQRKDSIVAAAALALVALALAGCGGSGSTGGGGGTHSSVPPKEGGTATIAQGEEVDTLAPQEAILPADINVVSQINEPLFRESAGGKLVPWLVSKVKTSDGQRVWTLTVRPGVKFSNGKPLTSADVLYTLETARTSTNWESVFEGVEKVEAPTPTTVVITNFKPAPELPSLLSQWSFGVEPKDFGGESAKEFASDPIGTGPFKLGPWKRGESLTLEKNPYYWQKGRPYLDTIVIKTVTDPNSRVAQLQSGELDVIFAPPAAQVEAIEAAPETGMAETPLGFNKVLQFEAHFPLFENKKVREAVNLALDREGMVQAVLHGNGEPAKAFVPPPIAFHDPDIEAPEHNPKKAKELLDEALKEGVDPSFTVIVPDEDDFWVDASQVVQQDLDEIGFKMKILKLDTSSWFELLQNGKYDAAASFLYSAVPTPTEFFGLYNAAQAQYTGAGVAQTTKLYNEAMSTVDVAARRQIYYHLQEIVYHQQWVLSVAYEPFGWAYRDEVTGLDVGASASLGWPNSA